MTACNLACGALPPTAQPTFAGTGARLCLTPAAGKPGFCWGNASFEGAAPSAEQRISCYNYAVSLLYLPDYCGSGVSLAHEPRQRTASHASLCLQT
jgi:hypothetical protein